MKFLFYFLLTTLHLTAFTQWTQLGSEVFGDELNEQFGNKLSFNAAGNVFIAGGPMNEIVGELAGYAKVYEWNGSDWSQKGASIYAEEPGDVCGYQVAIDGSGDRIAVTSVFAINSDSLSSGKVRVFDWDGDNWIQIGSDIEGYGHPLILESFGIALSFNLEGDRLAVGGNRYSAINPHSGYAKVFEWNGADWIQVGDNILGDGNHSVFGESVCMNAEGNRLAVGARGAYGFGEDQEGYIKSFELIGDTWTQMGDKIEGEIFGDSFGRSVSLNANGDILAVGAPDYKISEGDSLSQVYVYKWNGEEWTQMGETFTGIAWSNFGKSISLNNSGKILAIGEGSALTLGAAFIYQWNEDEELWEQIGETIVGEEYGSAHGGSLQLNASGNTLAVGAWGQADIGYVRVFKNDIVTAEINELPSIKLEYYPNPITDYLYLTSDTEILALQISTTDGKVLQRNVINGEKIVTVDLRGISEGLYILTVETVNNKTSRKILKN